MDVKCFDDLDIFGRETDSELEALEQDLYHRLLENQGENADDPARGLGLRSRLSGVEDPALQSAAENECRDDERVDAAKVTVTKGDNDVWSILAEIEANGEKLGLGIEIEQLIQQRNVQ